MPPVSFELHDQLDSEALHRRFLSDGHVQIAPFVRPEQARALKDHLLGRGDWIEVMNSGDRVFEISRADGASLSAEQRGKIDELVNASARDGFQYRYESVRVPDSRDERQSSGELLSDFAEFLSSLSVRDFFRQVTGSRDIEFADAQATFYRPGDFLTAHDDDVTGKNRRSAYVFGLTEAWRTEWGGLLMFHEADGDVKRALLPRFNCLNIFAVPQLHSVSQVAPFAATERMSVTGWLRASRPD